MCNILRVVEHVERPRVHPWPTVSYVECAKGGLVGLGDGSPQSGPGTKPRWGVLGTKFPETEAFLLINA